MANQKEVICFFILFLIVYFLESIGGFYMTSAVVSIEKQFQIPSRMSGLMVSAGDFGYIPSVVFVSYFGGKGNRARWIGFGCLLIAFGNILISTSNFLFPIRRVAFNSSTSVVNLNNNEAELNDHRVDDFANYSINSSKNFMNFPNYSLVVNSADPANIKILSNLPYAFCDIFLNKLRTEIEIIRCKTATSNMGPFLTIFGGLLILGIGRTMPFSLGLPLVDDNVKKRNLPIYFAGMFFIRILGPILGFLIGSVTNNLYYSFDVPLGLSPRDPMWIGRWWAGFLGIGIAMIGPSLGLYFFPSLIKKGSCAKKKYANDGNIEDGATENLRSDEENEIRAKKEETVKHVRNRSLVLVDRHAIRDEHGDAILPKTLTEKASDFISIVKAIMKSPVYVCTIIGRIIDVLAFKGFFVFLPKYLEVQFGLPQHQILSYLAVVGISGFAIGVIIGTAAMRFLKLQGRRAAGWVALCSAIAAIISFINATVGCKSALSLLGDQSTIYRDQFNNICNNICNCTNMPLYPVCNQNGEIFYSPCHAGCPYGHDLFLSASNKVFNNCLCSNNIEGVVSRSFCNQSICENRFLIYLINMAISGIFGGMGIVPAVLILLRSVPPIDRSVSLGFQGFLVSLLATLPSPVIWGWIVDRSCVLWNNVCSELSHGSCALYNADKLRLSTHIIYGAMRLISLTSDILVFYYAKDLMLTDEEPIDKAEESEPIKFIESIADDVIIDKDRKFSM